MRLRRLSLAASLLAAPLLAAALTSVTLVAPGTAVAHADTALPLQADYEMDEAPGTADGPAAMVDSSGHGLDGSVNVNVLGPDGQPDPSAPPRIVMGDTDETGATGTAYRFTGVQKDPKTGKTLPDDNHLALVPDDPRLDPLDRDYAIEVRFLTGAPSPNVVQKGQSGPNAPIFKVEVHEQKASCTLGAFHGKVFSKRGIGMPTTTAAITPNVWHTVRCDRTFNASRGTEDLTITVDGHAATAHFGAPSGSTVVVGTVNSHYPLSIGGKSDCDPSAGIGCDYFTGKMAYVRVYAASQPPVAAFTASCSSASCSADASGSSDPDGTVASYAWSWGDGTTSTTTTPRTTHQYAAGGTFPVTLTVTDDSGLSRSTSQSLTAPAVPGIAFRTSSQATATAATLKLALPQGVQPGDTLLLQTSAVSTSVPTAPDGWAQLSAQAFALGTATQAVWERTATSSDVAGSTVVVTLPASAKQAAVLLDYAGAASGTPAVASQADASLTTAHPSAPAAVATAGSVVATFWSDKSAGTSLWTPDSATTGRAWLYGTGTSRLTAFASDETPSSTGSSAVRTARTDVTSRAGVTTVVLAPSAG